MSNRFEVGPHLLLAGDLTLGVVGELMGQARADVIYSDPPWGPGNQKYWHTQNKHGSSPRTSWPEFLAAFCSACATYRMPEAPVFVEMGLRWVDELDAAMRAVGLEPRRRWSITYGPKSKPLPNVLSLFGPTDVDVVLPDPPHGEPITRAVLSAVVRPGSIVLDPCTGLGMTARITGQLGGIFRGTELNLARLTRAAASLALSARSKKPEAPAVDAGGVVESIRRAKGLPAAERVALFNAVQAALGELVADFAPDPACAPKLVPAKDVEANDYNPNRVAAPELDLLEQSMRADGITMCVVTMPDAGGQHTVIDGFHRSTVARERLRRPYLPCAVIDRDLTERMASTVRHNRARGKHDVELQAVLVKRMLEQGWSDAQIASALGMAEEESLRLRQIVGAAPAANALASAEYSREWAVMGTP